MKSTTERILREIEMNPGLTAREIAFKLDLNVYSVSMTLVRLYEKGTVERRIARERYCYYTTELSEVRVKVSKETQARHKEYVAKKTVGNRSYTCTHDDMLKILASQGDERAKEEIERRAKVNA